LNCYSIDSRGNIMATRKTGEALMSRKAFLPFLTLAMILSAAPAFSQNRFANEAREKADRRQENEAVRKAEHPEAQTAKATPAVEAEAAPAAPAAPAPAPATIAAPAQ
jgi:hypothetical protein